MTSQPRKKNRFLDIMEKLSPGTDPLCDWRSVSDVEHLDGSEEHRCACSHKVERGAIFASHTTRKMLILGTTCLKNFNKDSEGRTGRDKACSSAGPGEFSAIADPDIYSDAVLRNFKQRSTCHECNKPTEVIGFCTGCGKAFPACIRHKDEACQNCRREQEPEELEQEEPCLRRERDAQENIMTPCQTETRRQERSRRYQDNHGVIEMSCPATGGTVDFYICEGCGAQVGKCLANDEIIACAKCAGRAWRGHFVARDEE
jgi:hypothetical protein